MRPRRPTSSSSTFALLSLLLSSSSFATARTTSFDDQNSLLVYSPDTAWRVQDGDEGTATTRKGASLRVTFAGEQISLYGSTSAPFSVSIDGAPASSADSSTSGGLNSTEPVRIFLANELDREQVHELVLEVSGEGTLRMDRVAVAYSNDIDLIPALLPDGTTGAVSTATLSSSTTSSPSSASSSPSSSSALPASSIHSDGNGNGRGPAIVAGIIIGCIAAVALVVFGIVLFFRRSRDRSSDGLIVGKKRSSYHNADTGAPHHRRSTASGFLSALNFSRNSTPPLPLARSNPSSPANELDGGIGRSPHSHPFASPIAASYTRRSEPDRLETTKDFYRVPAPVVARGPPPAGPLPAVPGRGPSEEREMKERWRTEGPSLVASSRAPSRAAGAVAPPAEQYMTVQVFGQAMSDYAGSDEAHAPTESSRGQRRSVVAFPSVVSGGQHLRRRSWRQEEDGKVAPFSVPLKEGDMPLQALPSAAEAAKGRVRAPQTSVTSFRNPFSSSTPTEGGHSHSNSLAHSTTTTTTLDPRPFSTTSSDAEHASVEGAEIVAVSLQNNTTDEDTPLYSHGVGIAPVRMSSLRELHDTVRAGPRGDVSVNEVVKHPASIARRPTLTRRGETGGTGGSERSLTPRPPTQATVRPEDVVPEGYEEEEVVLSPEEEEEQRRAKHQSVAALIETVESFDELLDGSTTTGSGRTGMARDPPPGEEDRSAFFARRERMPRYSADGGDPRRVEWADGSISRR